MKTSKKGFSLIELLIVIAIFGIIITLGTSIFIFGSNASIKTNVEYTAQAEMRVAVQKLNNAIRDSSSAFVLYKENGNVKTKGWNYIMLSDDKKSLVEYKWDEKSGQHIKTIIVEPQEGITYNVSFNKDTEPYKDNLISYELERKLESGSSRKISSKVEALNALQVIDRAKEANKKNGSNRLVANALAYRTDARPGAVSQAKAAVSLVLDTSGSMGKLLQEDKSRIYFLKQEAANLIEGLSKNQNIYVSLNPFSDNGNASEEMKQVSTNKGEKNIDDSYPYPSLLYTIDDLEAKGGTNTGDGMRRAFYRIKEFNEKDENKNENIKNFLVILVDGETTFASVHKIGTDYISFWDSERSSLSPVQQNGLTYTYYTTYTEWKGGFLGHWEEKHYFINKGDVYLEREGNMSNSWVRSYNTNYYLDGVIYGNGSSWDYYGRKYVEIIGKKIMEYQKGTPKAIKVYVIGYAGEASSESLKEIAKFTTGDENNWVRAGNSQALKEIFDAIRFDINDSLWHIGGPQ